jgi:hypothetical protein
MILILTAG